LTSENRRGVSRGGGTFTVRNLTGTAMNAGRRGRRVPFSGSEARERSKRQRWGRRAAGPEATAWPKSASLQGDWWRTEKSFLLGYRGCGKGGRARIESRVKTYLPEGRQSDLKKGERCPSSEKSFLLRSKPKKTRQKSSGQIGTNSKEKYGIFQDESASDNYEDRLDPPTR